LFRGAYAAVKLSLLMVKVAAGSVWAAAEITNNAVIDTHWWE